jgi:hypothetical protein
VNFEDEGEKEGSGVSMEHDSSRKLATRPGTPFPAKSVTRNSGKLYVAQSFSGLDVTMMAEVSCNAEAQGKFTVKLAAPEGSTSLMIFNAATSDVTCDWNITALFPDRILKEYKPETAMETVKAKVATPREFVIP